MHKIIQFFRQNWLITSCLLLLTGFVLFKSWAVNVQAASQQDGHLELSDHGAFTDGDQSQDSPVPQAVSAITIDTAFDSGSINSYTVAGSVVDMTLRVDNIDYEYWANFQVSGLSNQPVTFNITGVSDVPFLAEQTKENQMVYSCDGDNWQRLTQHSYSAANGGTYTFVQTFPCDTAQIAMFFPFSSQKMSAYVDNIAASPWATKSVLGLSHQDRDLDLLTITNTAVPTASKKVIYIIGRQHAAETGSSHMLEGMLDFLVSNSSSAKRMRDRFIWYIVPMVNPDGVYLGNSRETSEGNDPNRDWHPDNNDTVEISTVRNHIVSVDGTEGIDMFIDWHTQMNDDRWYNFIYAPSGNGFFSILSKWTDFDNQSTGGTSCSTGSCSSRGYNTIYGISLNFVFEPSPHLVTWTEASLQQQGKNTAFAIDEYFYGATVTGDTVYVSSSYPGLVGGVSFANEDIISHEEGTDDWAMVWDGSDVGVTVDLDAFAFMDDGSLLMSFNVANIIRGLGVVDDSDIVRFVPTTLGPDTAGTFELYFDGSDVGLTEINEAVDALALTSDGRLLLSTSGSYSVSGVSGEDEDLLVFDPTSLGPNTAGSWSLYFNGSAVSLDDTTLEDVWGTWIDNATGEIYLTTRDVFDVPGVRGGGEDVFVCDPGSLGNSTTCTYGPGIYWDGSASGFPNDRVDGFSISLSS